MIKLKRTELPWRLTSLWFLLLVLIFGCEQATQEGDQYVVMLSLDGFRWDYTDRVPTPNFDRIAQQGVKAESLRPVFPTKTFPNHYSIATGLYPDHHGIVMNSFFDEATGRYYKISDREAVRDGSFYSGEPIWVTAEKQGKKAASCFWVGSEASIGGYTPSHTKTYRKNMPFEERADTVISWLMLPEPKRPELILWYYHEPDNTGHEWGPDSPQVDSVVMMLDSLLGIFLDKLAALPFADRVNVIVTSDHGMGKVDSNHKVVLEEHLAKEWVAELQGNNPNYNIKINPGFIDSAFQSLSRVEGVKVWKSGSLPERLHYGLNQRTLDLVVVAEPGRGIVRTKVDKLSKGAHGYDNADPDMHAIFFAFGPAFRENYVSPTFDNIDIYPLICSILHLEPAPVDGTLEDVKKLLEIKE